FFQRFVEFLGRAEVMERQDEGGAGTQLLELLWLALIGGLQFDIDQLATCGSGFSQNIQLRGNGTPEFSSAGDPAAAGNGYRTVMGLEETLDFGEGQAGLGKIV